MEHNWHTSVVIVFRLRLRYALIRCHNVQAKRCKSRFVRNHGNLHSHLPKYSEAYARSVRERQLEAREKNARELEAESVGSVTNAL